jgi:Na+-transporting methylmalonyl-CoA/oxaloacetate decarboxylase gamma subunit
MTLPNVSVLDASFVLAVAGAGMIWAPLALFVAAAYFAVQAALHYRNPPPPPEVKP